MQDTKLTWKDGTAMTNTASLCQKMGGLKYKSINMTNLHWKISPILRHEEKEIVLRKVGYSS